MSYLFNLKRTILQQKYTVRQNLQGICYKLHPMQEVIREVSFKNLFSDTWNENGASVARYLTIDLNIAISHLHSKYYTPTQ